MHTLAALLDQIRPADTAVAAAAAQRLDTLTKPPGSLGALEALLIRLAAATGQIAPRFAKPMVLIAAADHGVVAEGVSPYPQSVTAQMVRNFLAGGAAINALAANANAEVVVVDAGIASDLADTPGLLRAAVRPGSANLLHEPALQRAEAAALMLAGAQLVEQAAANGMDLLALGEMGIGNTTAAACLTCVMANIPAQQATGRGTGLDDAGLAHKRRVVAAAVARACATPGDPIGVLAELGGCEIALLAGATLAAAARRIPVVLDGYITTSAALIATALAPNTSDYLVASHRSAEPGHQAALATLGLKPLLDLELRLGEGSGAALAIPLIQGATRLMRDMATFASAGVDGATGEHS